VFTLLSNIQSFFSDLSRYFTEGSVPVWVVALILFLAGLSHLAFVKKEGNPLFQHLLQRKRKKLVVWLEKDRIIRPTLLTLKVENTGKRFVDFDAPVLIFRKLWTRRKFKLTGINNSNLFPLYMEPGQAFSLPIHLELFYQHNNDLKKFYQARVIITDVDGKVFKTKYIVLRKSIIT